MKYKQSGFSPLQPHPASQEDERNGNDITQVMENIDLRHELDEENNRLSSIVKVLADVNLALCENINKGEAATRKIEQFLNKFELLIEEVHKADNVLKATISNARNLKITSMIEEKSMDNLKVHEAEVIDYFKDLLRNNRGVWLSDKVFWWSIGIFAFSVLINIFILYIAIGNK